MTIPPHKIITVGLYNPTVIILCGISDRIKYTFYFLPSAIAAATASASVVVVVTAVSAEQTADVTVTENEDKQDYQAADVVSEHKSYLHY